MRTMMALMNKARNAMHYSPLRSSSAESEKREEEMKTEASYAYLALLQRDFPLMLHS